MLHWRDDYLEYILVFSRNPKTLHDTQADELFPKKYSAGLSAIYSCSEAIIGLNA